MVDSEKSLLFPCVPAAYSFTHVYVKPVFITSVSFLQIQKIWMYSFIFPLITQTHYIHCSVFPGEIPYIA